MPDAHPNHGQMSTAANVRREGGERERKELMIQAAMM